MDFAAQLKARLLQGEWLAGQRLPSIRKFAAVAHVSQHTVFCAYRLLLNEGLLQAQHGRGYFVASRVNATKSVAAPQSIANTNNPLLKLLQAPSEYVKLGCGWLPSHWHDTEVLARAVRKTARSGHGVLLGYGDIQGYLPLRQQLATNLKRLAHIEPPVQQLLTTLGATQAFDLIFRLLIKPGDVVLVDEPCSGNLIRLIGHYGALPLGVARLVDGPDLEVLDAILQKHQVKLFLCNSNYHNPSGASVTQQVAFQVLQRAIKHDFWVVEDDVYGDFYSGIRPTFAQFDNLERVIYVGSFSKSLSASLRVGFIACAKRLIEPLTELKLLTAVVVPSFCERFVSTILGDGSYLRHAQDMGRRLMTQQTMVQAALKQYGWKFDIAPEGGMFLWLSHPDIANLDSYRQRLEQNGILLLPGNNFSVTRNFQQHTRINIAHMDQGVLAHFDLLGGCNGLLSERCIMSARHGSVRY